MEDKYRIYSYHVIYDYTIPDTLHAGLIKVADRLIALSPSELKEAEQNPDVLKIFIDDQLPQGAELSGIWLGMFKNATGEKLSVKLADIYDVLEESHEYVAMRGEDRDKWFKADLKDVEDAVELARRRESGEDNTPKERKIVFRPEQTKTITETVEAFRSGRTRYLWNAKMRFGKTLCALQVAKDMGYKFTLIVTHRPVVDDGWEEDFMKIFKDKTHYHYSKRNDKDKETKGFDQLIEKVRQDPEGRLVFFASIQYLRGSHLVMDPKDVKKNYKENKEKTAILNFDWDFVVIDEAHEGTQSERGVEVMRYMKLNVPDTDEMNNAASSSDVTVGGKAADADDGIEDADYVDLDKDGNEIKKDIPAESKEKPTSPRKGKPVTLALSGTPFNLYSEYSPSEISTWDYVREQQAKADWHKTNGDDPNPYDVLPRLNIFNLDIEDTIGHRIVEPGESEENCSKQLSDDELDEDYAGFSFSNFFKVWDKTLCKKHGKPESFAGSFVHEAEIMEFFHALAKETKADSNFPFSTPEFRKAFRHTFWLIPGVKEGEALKELLEREKWTVRGAEVPNPYYKGFRVINAAGNEQEDLTGEALQDVKDHIALTKGQMPKRFKGINPDSLKKSARKEYDELKAKLADWKGKYTITLSCGKLTTGVSVPEWTAVFYMKGNDSTSASTYMQTIFRVQTPAVIDGAQKTDCYVFDFSPIRSLRVFADAVRLNMSSELGNDRTTKYSREDQKEAVKKWLEVLPFQAISVPKPGVDKTHMEPYDADKLFSQLDARLIDRVVRSGYADNSIYDSVAIMDLAPEAEEALARISMKITADSKSNEPGGDIKVGKDAPKKPTKKQEKDAQNAAGKKDDELTEEEKAARKAVEDWKRQRRERMKTLRAMSVRIPLLMYGADIKDRDELEISNFTTLVDDESWTEFMPPNITKADFDAVRDCYDSVRFKGSAEKIREFAENSDKLSITDRVKEVARIFSFFHNPDKETVLTPWRVVNMHMADTIGGFKFFAEDNRTPLAEPVKIEQEGVTDKLFITPESGTFEELEKVHILEINSKTGLYPLYVAYSMFRARKEHYEQARLLNPDLKVKEDHDIWAETLKENIFVVCKTPMAVDITRRTLAGFTGCEVNAICPSWEVPEKILAAANVIKIADGQTPDDEKLIKTDLVGILRTKEEIEKENKRRESRGEKPLDLIFTDQVRQRSWWEKNLNRSLDPHKFNDEMIKFNAVVGNPPYQEVDGGGTGSSAIPLYNLFVDAAKIIYANYISMIIPAKWYSGGRGLDEFRQKMLNDTKLKCLVDFQDSRDCFPTVDIAGGICYFLIDKNHKGKCTVINNHNGNRHYTERNLNEFDTFIRDYRIVDIINKVHDETLPSLSQKVYSRKPFGLRSFDTGFPAKPGRDICLFGSDGISYLEPSQVPQNLHLASKWKVIMSKASAEHAGQTDKDGRKRIVSRLEVLPPGTICTESYLLLDVFENESEAVNLKKYIKTQFVRFLLSSILITQNIVRDKFRFVPFQDFTSKSDIDWSKSIKNIDQQLYKKYNLDQPEIDFIESMIKPME